MSSTELDLNHYHPRPSKPSFVPPAGAVDAHCHVFGPGDVFPYAPERKYTPGDAPKEALFALRDSLGFARNVVVQATCHGTDNRATVDALEAAGERARGIAVVDYGISDAELHALHTAGVRGVRFNFLKRLVDATPRERYAQIAERIKPLGWHIVVYFEAPELEDLEPFITGLDATVVVDHMGRPDVDLGLDHPQWQRFIALMDEHPNIWVKVSGAERLSKTGPPYDDVVPFGRALVERYPERVLWGTDWPHPNMTTHMPDDGALVDFIPRIASTAALQHKLLVENPMRLYWPEA
jgi:2-pyrone-4,6-dicarboxylate lactonase